MTGTVITRAPKAGEPLLLRFDDNALLPLLFGDHDKHLAQIEEALGVMLSSRGNEVAVSGEASAVETAAGVLTALYEKLKRGAVIGRGEIDAQIRMTESNGSGSDPSDEIVIRTRRQPIMPRSPRQADYIRAMRHHDLVFALGPAGTGKTYLAAALAVSMYISGQVERIILSRPAVEAGERLGFLPGDLREKVDPYLRPLYDALHDMLPADIVARRIETGEIEIAPLAFMRGRTLSNAFVILDEAQNTTPVQMKMFLTRLGEHSRMVVTGDLSQIDLPASITSGLTDALDTLEGMEGAAFIRFTNTDIQRNPLVTRIVRAYESREQASQDGGNERP